MTNWLGELERQTVRCLMENSCTGFILFIAEYMFIMPVISSLIV